MQKEVMLTEKRLRWKPRSDSSPEQSEENFSGQKSSFQIRAGPGSGQRLGSLTVMGTWKSGRQLVILFRVIDAVLIV